MFIDFLRSIFGRFVVVFVYGNVFVFVRVGCRPRNDGRAEEREPSRDECEEVLEEPRDWLNRVDALASCVVGIVAVRTDSLVVHQADPAEDAVLHQRVHDGAVDLPEELSSVFGALGDEDKAVVVEEIAVEFVRCAGLLAGSTAGAL